MKKGLLLILVMLLTIHIHGQQTITLKDGKLVNKVLPTIPTRDVSISSSGEITVTYAFSSAILQKDDLFKESYWWKVDGFGFEEEPGKPSVLSRLDQFSIPKGVEAKVEIIDSFYKDFNFPITPARLPLIDSGDDVYTKENVKPIDSSLGIYPISIVEVCNIQQYRGNGILSVKVSPIQYDVKNKKIRAYTKIKYKVTYTTPRNSAIVDNNASPITAVDDNFLSNTTLNGLNTNEQKEDVNSQNIQDYLIISVPKYTEAVNAFAEWKKMLGFNVHIKIENSWTPNSVKETVKNLYAKKNSLYYMLIVGDQEDVPGSYSTHGYASHVTDLWYGCMDGENDFTPDIYRGRLSVNTANEALTVVNKIIQYERNPILTSTFYNKGVNCAYFQDVLPKDDYADRRFAQTSENVRDYLQTQGKSIQRIYCTHEDVTPTHWNRGMYSNGENIPVELLKPIFAWNGKATDITSSINAGAFYVLHRDHGATWGWGDPRYTVENVNSLSNGNKLPVVFSMNCLTGQFNSNSGTCFAEAFLRKPNGGCVGIFAATESSMSGYNDALTGGMFDAIWPSPGLRIVMPSQSSTAPTPTPTYRLGQILDQGFARMTEIYGANAMYTRYTKELFHCFGDPSMQIYTDVPTIFTNVLISRRTNNISVSLPNVATISFYDLVNGTVSSYIGNNITHNVNHPQNVTICISGHNKIPYIQAGEAPTTTYIQNETIVGPKTYTGSIIKVGSDVTITKPYGPVIFQNGEVKLTANEIEIRPNTTIKKEANLQIILK